jgi:cytochrome c
MLKRSLVVIVVLLTAGCLKHRGDLTLQVRHLTGGGNAQRGAFLIHQYGCGGCHTIPGVPGAYGLTGPSLERVALRTYLAGRLTNTPENMMRWIRDPVAIDSMTAMPKVGLDEIEARHIAAYLYTLQ